MNLTDCCTAASTLLRNARGLASGSSSNTRRRNTRRSRHSLAPADILEPRLLLAGDATLDSAGKLTVTGTADNDIITVSILAPSNSPRQTQIAINSSSFSFDAVLVKSIHVSAGTGNDRITVSPAVTIPCSLFGQDGDDVLIAGSGADQLFGGAGNDTMTGGNGSDRYVLEPAAGTERDTVSEADDVGVDTIDFSSLTESLAFSLATSAWQSAGTGRTLQLNARDRFENLIGGTGNDTLTGNALANQLSGGPGNDSLFGGLGNDTYLFQPAETPETDFISEALNAGSDTVDFSAITDNLTFAINTNAIQPSHLGRSLQLNAGDRFENVIGGRGDDRLTGNVLANRLDGGPGSNVLVGGDQDDIYAFTQSEQPASDLIVELLGGGIDALDFSACTSAVTAHLGTSAIQTITAGRTLQLNAADRIENITGGRGNDRLTGNSLPNTLTGGPGDDSLAGAAGNDTYLFADTDTAEADFITEDRDNGIDTLDFHTLHSAVKVHVGTSAIQNVHRLRTLQLNAGDRIENVIGCGYGNRLTGNALNNVLQGGYGSDELIGAAGNDTLVGSYGNDILVGGQGDDLCYGMIGDDTYIFHPAVSPEADIIFEPADGGIETLNFTSCILPVTLRLNTSLVQQADLYRTLQLNSPSRFENAVGGSGNDHLTGNTLANSLTGGPGADVLEGGPGPDRLNGGSGSDELRGDSGDDLYVFSSAVTAEADFLVEQANAGIDTLDFSGLSQDVELHLGTSAIQPVHAFRTLQLNAADRFENTVGGIGNDRLTGNALNNVLTGNPGNDRLDGQAGDDTLFGSTGSDVLIGGEGSDIMYGMLDNDTYMFFNAFSPQVDLVREISDGVDTLDFSALTAAVTARLDTAVLQNVHPNRQLQLNAANLFENLIGGSGDDQLTGNTQANIVAGNGGDDVLTGALGRDILIGGRGRDQLFGGDDQDILISGFTTLDANPGSLIQIRNEWTSGTAIDSRISKIRAGVSTEPVALAAGTTVLDTPGETDNVQGSADTDWFFCAPDDSLDRLLSETLDVL